MLIFPDLKLIYIRVPKTGSNSFFHAMKNRHKSVVPNQEELNKRRSWSELPPPRISLYEHFTANQARQLIPKEVWDSYEKIAFVRNPYDWVVSLYDQRGIDSVLGEDESKPFPEFLRNLKLTPFTWFLDGDEKMLIDTIYRMEDIDEVFDKYDCKHLHLMKRKHFARNPVLTDEDREVIKAKFQRELAYYK